MVITSPGDLRFDASGLIPAIAQDAENGQVLMLAYMNAEAVFRTLETGLAHYYSRSRQRLWRKGEESGHVQRVRAILYDCDEDALLVPVAALRFTPPRATAGQQESGSFIERLMPRPPRQAGKEPAAAVAGSQVHVLRAGAPVAVPVTTGSSDGQVTRIAGPDVPGVPYNHVLEDWFMVNPEKIADGIRKLAAY